MLGGGVLPVAETPGATETLEELEAGLATLRAKIARAKAKASGASTDPLGVVGGADAPDPGPKVDLKSLKATAIDTLETVLVGAESEDVRRKAAVDILNFSEKSKNENPVTEEQLGWLGRVIIEAEEIRLGVEVGEK